MYSFSDQYWTPPNKEIPLMVNGRREYEQDDKRYHQTSQWNKLITKMSN